LRFPETTESPLMTARYFNQLAIGDHIVHPIRRTVTETDNLLWSAMTHNPQPLHLDAEAAKATEFGQILVNSTFTLSLMVGLSVEGTTHGSLIANLGFDKIVLPKPVFIGDTLRCESTVTALRESNSRPNAGIATWEHRLYNQRDEIVCQGLRTAMLLREPAA
jgi:acyl dehydratase